MQNSERAVRIVGLGHRSRTRTWAGLLLCAATGCAEPVEVDWMQGFGFDWAFFNHRLSHMTVQAGRDDQGQRQVAYAVVGGASTTGVAFEEDTSCVAPDFNCGELPLEDETTGFVRHATLRSEYMATGRTQLTVAATPSGATAQGLVSLTGRVGRNDPLTGLISGVSLRSEGSLPDAASALSCYDPRHGWNPRAMAVDVVAVRATDLANVVEVEVSATFEAGATYEDLRACLDAVHQEVVLPMVIDVSVIAGGVAQTPVSVSTEASYGFRDEAGSLVPQPPPAPLDVALAPNAAWGWSSLSWRFFQSADEAAPLRGAYLRDLSVVVDVAGGTANGFATSFSPGTQQSGFEMAFEGTLAGAAVSGAELTETTWRAEGVPAALDEAGAPILGLFPAVTP